MNSVIACCHRFYLCNRMHSLPFTLHFESVGEQTVECDSLCCCCCCRLAFLKWPIQRLLRYHFKCQSAIMNKFIYSFIFVGEQSFCDSMRRLTSGRMCVSVYGACAWKNPFRALTGSHADWGKKMPGSYLTLRPRGKFAKSTNARTHTATHLPSKYPNRACMR